tara:strand:+ start:1251 stop:1970 length:720 start_codon:yes stop_codon:yes gene_type:complete
MNKTRVQAPLAPPQRGKWFSLFFAAVAVFSVVIWLNDRPQEPANTIGDAAIETPQSEGVSRRQQTSMSPHELDRKLDAIWAALEKQNIKLQDLEQIVALHRTSDTETSGLSTEPTADSTMSKQHRPDLTAVIPLGTRTQTIEKVRSEFNNDAPTADHTAEHNALVLSSTTLAELINTESIECKQSLCRMIYTYQPDKEERDEFEMELPIALSSALMNKTRLYHEKMPDGRRAIYLRVDS